MFLIKIIFFVLFFLKPLNAGEIDGNGIICSIYGDTVGFFFDNDRTFEYKLLGGNKELELSKKDIGKYFTNENSIYFGEIKVDRKTLKFQKYSSFRGSCKAYKGFDEFKKNFDIESLTEGNKI